MDEWKIKTQNISKTFTFLKQSGTNGENSMNSCMVKEKKILKRIVKNYWNEIDLDFEVLIFCYCN